MNTFDDLFNQFFGGERNKKKNEGKDPLDFNKAKDENIKKLIEMISNMDNDDIAMEFSLPNRASLILPIKNNDDEEILMLIMPMMISQ